VDALLGVQDLTVRFGGVTAVDGVTATIEDGQFVGLIGPNGAGKTTFVDICSGFMSPDSGRLTFDSKDITELPPADRAERGVGRTFQDARLWPSVTVREAVAIALDRHVDVRDPLACAFRGSSVAESERLASRRAEEILQATGLDPYRDTFVGELSTGSRRILEIACAIAHAPDLLFLDEPTAGVAQRESEELGELLRELRDERGMTLVIVEHNIPVISGIADRLICLDLGSVLASGTPAAVLSDKAVLASYLGSEEPGSPRRKATKRKTAKRKPQSRNRPVRAGR
jgi:branched-chain amino acid transport system ATP-binding protein